MSPLPRLLRDPFQRQAFNRATSWLRLLARVGYLSKGVVYVVMGLLAARAAFRIGSDVTSFRGALLRIVDKPFGHTMLAVLAVGFAGYAAWQILSAVIDAEDAGEAPPGLASRAEQLFTGVLYGSLAHAAAYLLLVDDSTSRRIEYHWSAWVTQIPFGHAMLQVIGAGLLGYGLYQLWRARSERSLTKRVSLPELTPASRFAIVTMGRFGLVMRGVVFAVFGWLVFQGGRSQGYAVAENIGDALRALGSAPAGPWVLALVAAGLIAHGCYQFVNARYRRLRERRLWPSEALTGTRAGDKRALPSTTTPAAAD